MEYQEPRHPIPGEVLLQPDRPPTHGVRGRHRAFPPDQSQRGPAALDRRQSEAEAIDVVEVVGVVGRRHVTVVVDQESRGSHPGQIDPTGRLSADDARPEAPEGDREDRRRGAEPLDEGPHASFTYSKSPGLLSMPTRGEAIQPAYLPGCRSGVAAMSPSM